MNIYIIVLSLFIFFFQSTYPVTKGSETAVSVEPSYTFTGTGNEMLGFGWFKNGFVLQDSSTTCSFNDVFPVSGTVNLNGGTLYLEQDLLFSNVTNLLGMGKIYGYDHFVEFGSSITSFPADAEEFSDVILNFNNHITLNSEITFKGNCTLDGKGNNFYIGTGSIVVDSGSTLTIKNMWLRGVSGSNVRCADDTATLVLDNIKWVQSGDVTFEHGGIYFENFVDFCASFTFSYESVCTSTIAFCSRWTLAEGITLSIASDNNQPLDFSGGLCSSLRFDCANWSINSPGMLIDRGVLEFAREVTIDINSTSTSDGLILGDGNITKDLCFDFLPGTVIHCPRGHLVYDVVMDDWIVSESLTARLIRDADSHFYVKQDLTFKNVSITSDPACILDVADEKTITWNNVNYIQADGEYQTQSKRYNAYTFLLNGDDYIFLKRGNFVGAILVNGTGNKFQGGGTLNGPIQFVDENSSLEFDFSGVIDYGVGINGGTFTLLQDCELMNGSTFTGNGTVNLGTGTIIGGYNYWTEWVGTYTWQSIGGGISLNSIVAINGSWIIDGNCFIDANNRTIDLTNGEIIVTDGSLLFLQNAVIKGLSGKKIRCEGNGANIALYETTLHLEDDYTFDTGALTAYLNVDIVGTSTFSYLSPQPFIIESNTNLKISDVVCQLGPSVGTSHMDWFTFTDATSNLILDDCNLNIGSDGVLLTKGIITLSRDVIIDVDSTSTANGIIMGDGNPENDFALEFEAGGSMDVVRGHITYNVTSGDGIRARSKYTRLKRRANTVFYVRKSLTFTDFVLDDESNAIAIADPGVMVLYENCTQRISDGLRQSKFRCSSYVYGDVDQLLAGGQSIWLDMCGLPIKVYVLYTGNRIIGEGNLYEPIILLDSSAEIILSVNGLLLGGIVLNGGTLVLEDSIGGIGACGPGTIDLSCHDMQFNFSPQNWTEDILWKSNNGNISLNSDVTLSSTWTFSGSCVINGNGHQLDMSDGSIVLDPNSNLVLRDIVIDSISGDAFICDDTSTLKLNNVTWIQDGTYTFSTGSLVIKEKVKMKGNHTFEYVTSSSTMILHDSMLKLENGFTFDYRPTQTAANLIVMEDESSILELSGGSLHAYAYGLQLTNGTLRVFRDSYVSSDITTTDNGEDLITIDEGIVFGDELAEHDIVCQIGSGICLELEEGTLKYKNVDSSSFVMHNSASRLKINDAASLDLYQNIEVDPGIVAFGNNTMLRRFAGKSIIGSVSLQGQLNYGQIM